MFEKNEITSRFIRGTTLVSDVNVNRNQTMHIRLQMVRDELMEFDEKVMMSYYIRLGRAVFLPRKFEPEHGIIIGKPGQGKTLLLYEFIKRLRNRNLARNKNGKRLVMSTFNAVIYDTKGDYISKFYNYETDCIFNPMDERSVKWTIFNEIRSENEMEEKINVDAICKSLIPDTGDPQADYWNSTARTVLASIFHYCRKSGRRTNAELWDVLTLPISTLRRLLEQYPESRIALKHIEGDNQQTSGIVSTLTRFTECLEFVKDMDGDFSIRDFMNEKDNGFLFVSNYAKTRDSMKPLLSLFIDQLANNLLSMPDDQDRRRFFLLDEFGTLQNLPSIVQLLTMSRSKGGSVWIAVQDFGQLEKIYGMEHRKTIFNACGTHIYFAVADAKTAEELSQNVGDAEYLEKHYSKTEWEGRSTVSHQKALRAVLLPSQIMNLEKFKVIMTMPNYPFIKSEVALVDYENKSEAFIIRTTKGSI